MKSFINIEIKDSFNKKDNSHKKDDFFSNNISTLNKENVLGTYSESLGSIPGNSFDGNINIVGSKGKGIIREIIIGTICAVLSAIISYFIFGIK